MRSPHARRRIHKPLAGRTVIVTRPRAQAAPLAAALRARGARVTFAPLIRIAPPRSWRALDQALRSLGRFDAAVFTSANAVESFFRRARKISAGSPRPPRLVAAVGPATAKALAARGWRARRVPGQSRAQELARTLRPALRLAHVLIPRAERGREELPRLLRAGGVRVTCASAYRTTVDPRGQNALRRALAGGAYAVCFASGSAAASAAAALGPGRMRQAFRRCAAIAIGPTTAAALRARGVTAAAVAETAGAPALAAAVARALEDRP